MASNTKLENLGGAMAFPGAAVVDVASADVAIDNTKKAIIILGGTLNQSNHARSGSENVTKTLGTTVS